MGDICILGPRLYSGGKGKKRGEIAKKNERANQALGWTGEGERAQTPVRLASLAETFRLVFYYEAWSKARNLD